MPVWCFSGKMKPWPDTLPEWEDVLSAAARLQSILPGTVLVGGTAAAMHVGRRLSTDADPTMDDLKGHFDEVLQTLEAVAGWSTARVKRPVMILGSLDGIETGVRQLIREEPLETGQEMAGLAQRRIGLRDHGRPSFRCHGS